MPTKTLLSLAIVALLAVTASAESETYTVATTNNWFSENVSGYDVSETMPSGVNGTWTKPLSGRASVVSDSSNKVIALDTAVNDPLCLTVSTNILGVTVSEYSIVVYIKDLVFHADCPTLSSAPYGSLVAVSNGESGVTWRGLSFSGGETVWLTLAGHTPIEYSSYYAKMDVKLSASDAKVRYSVSADGTTYTALTYDLNEWLDAGKDGVTVPVLKFAGYGKIGGSIDAKGVSYISCAYDVGSLFSGSTVDENSALYKSLVAAGMSGITTDTRASDIQTFFNANGTGNNLPNWQNYVLGLDGTKSSAKPFAAPEQNDNANMLTFKLGGVLSDSITASGKKVTFAVYETDDPNSQGSVVVGTAGTASDGSADVTLTGSGVKYYRVKVTIAD